MPVSFGQSYRTSATTTATKASAPQIAPQAAGLTGENPKAMATTPNVMAGKAMTPSEDDMHDVSLASEVFRIEAELAQMCNHLLARRAMGNFPARMSQYGRLGLRGDVRPTCPRAEMDLVAIHEAGHAVAMYALGFGSRGSRSVM